MKIESEQPIALYVSERPNELAVIATSQFSIDNVQCVVSEGLQG